MRCPYCSSEGSKVIDSRPIENDTIIRRRRECEVCKKRFTTFEKTEIIPLVVIKKDGTRSSFDKNKILNGMVKACEKLPVPLKNLKLIADDIERRLYVREIREVSSVEIGEQVMDALKHLDQVAYVRFASVYREFKDVDSFMKELSLLKAENPNETAAR